MERVQALALTLRAVRFEDRHLVVTALTEESGLMTALAKNAVQSRRFGGCLEPFVASEWSLRRKPDSDLVFLEQAQVRRAYEGLRSSVEKLSMASALNEFVLRGVPPEQPAPEIFRLHANALAMIEESQENPPVLLLVAYLGKLMQWNGTAPTLAQCSLCDRPLSSAEESTVHFNVSDSSWSCLEHELRGMHARTLTASSLQELERVLRSPIRSVAETCLTLEAQRSLFQLIFELALFHYPGFERGESFRSLELLGLGSNRLQHRSTPRFQAAES